MSGDDGRTQTGFSLGQIQAREKEEWNFYVDKLIPKRGLTILGGESGVGKSHLLLSMVFAIASGEQALGCLNTEPVKVQVFTEDDIHILKPYVDRIGANFPDADPDAVNFQTGVKDFTTMWRHVDEFKPQIVVIDPMMRIASGTNSNHNEDVNDMLDGLKYACDQRDVALVYTRHMRKPHPNESMDEATAFRRVIGAQAWISNPYHRLVMWHDKGEYLLTSYSKFMENFHWQVSFNKQLGRLMIDKSNGSTDQPTRGSKYTNPIFEIYNRYPGTPYSAVQIAAIIESLKLMDEVKPAALRAELRRLAKEGKLVKDESGSYKVPTLVESVEANYIARHASFTEVSDADEDNESVGVELADN